MLILNYAAVAVLTTLVFYLLVVGKPILLPFVIALFIWYLINALATIIGRVQIHGQQLPVWLRFSLSILSLLLVLWFVLDLIIANIGQVSQAAPTYEQNLRQLALRASAWLGIEELPSIRAMLEGVNLSNMLRQLLTAVTGIMGSTGTVLIYVAFLLLEQSSFNKKIAALFPNPEREQFVHRILQRIASEVQTYVWLKTIGSLLTAVLSYLVMKVIGVDFAEFWALLIFALNYIPYIGALLGVVFPALIALVQFETLTPFVITVAVLTGIQFAIGNVLEPRMMGKGLNISPLIMLIALAVWGSIWGIAGMFLAVPMMVIVMIICSNFEASRPVAIVLSEDGQLRH
ncbi:MAG: AI-2E family transporter [Gammaproteobacteria bacterium]